MPSKRYLAQQAKIDSKKAYSLDEAAALVKETGGLKFNSSVEVHLNLGIDPSKSDQQIRGTVVLPHGTGKTLKIAAFISPNFEKAAREAGADFVYNEDDIKKIKDTGKIENFDIAVASPDMMPKLALAAKVLGPKGLMPNPKTDTVGTDMNALIGSLKKGKASFKTDDTSNIHIGVGKVSFTKEQIAENILTFIDTIKKMRPSSAKGVFIRSAFVSTTMGPSIRLKID